MSRWTIRRILYILPHMDELTERQGEILQLIRELTEVSGSPDPGRDRRADGIQVGQRRRAALARAGKEGRHRDRRRILARHQGVRHPALRAGRPPARAAGDRPGRGRQPDARRGARHRAHPGRPPNLFTPHAPTTCCGCAACRCATPASWKAILLAVHKTEEGAPHRSGRGRPPGGTRSRSSGCGQTAATPIAADGGEPGLRADRSRSAARSSGHRGRAVRRGRAVGGVPPRAVTFVACSLASSARLELSPPSTARGWSSARPRRRPVWRRRLRLRSGVSASPSSRRRRDASRSTSYRRRFTEPRSAGSQRGIASTSSRRFASAIRSAATSCRAMSTQSATSARSTPEGDSRRVWFDAPERVVRYCLEKGSIAVDGVSLTVAALDDDGFEVALIPHTLAVTTLGELEPGDESTSSPTCSRRSSSGCWRRGCRELRRHAVRLRRGGDRGHPEREDGGRRRRSRIARTRATSSSPRSSRRPRPSTSWRRTRAG